MTASGNIEIVRRGYEALGRWEVESLLPDCDPEIEFVSLVGQVEGHIYRGHDGMRKMVADIEARWGHVFRFRDGKLVWSQMYSDPDEARDRYEALGADG